MDGATYGSGRIGTGSLQRRPSALRRCAIVQSAIDEYGNLEAGDSYCAMCNTHRKEERGVWIVFVLVDRIDERRTLGDCFRRVVDQVRDHLLGGDVGLVARGERREGCVGVLQESEPERG